MHRLVQVAEEMHYHLQSQYALRVWLFGVEHDADFAVQRSDYVAARQCGCRFVCLVSVDILIVPGYGIDVFRGVRGIVEPVGVIDYRLAVEQ